MTPYQYRIGGEPDYYAAPTNGDPHETAPASVHTNRDSIYYPGDTVHRVIKGHVDAVTGFTVRSLLPAVFSPYRTGDIVKTGAVTLDTPAGSYYQITLGTAGTDFPPGAYRVYYTGAPKSDPVYGDSYGVSQFVVKDTFPGHIDVRTLNSGYAVTKYYPSGFGMTDDQVVRGVAAFREVDMILRAALGMGVGRTEMAGTADIGLVGQSFDINGSAVYHDQLNAAQFFENAVQPYWLNPEPPVWKDPLRPRTGWMNYIYYYTSYDNAIVQNDGTQAGYITYANVYPKTPSIDGTKVFVKAHPTSAELATIEVYYPNASTLVESYTGLFASNIASSINGASAYVRAYAGGANLPAAMGAPVAIGNNCRTKLIRLVQLMAPLGCTRFEVPENEPPLTEEVAHQFWLAQAAVAAAGVEGVKAIGPSPVSLSASWDDFFNYLKNTAGLTKDDFGVAFHDYNDLIAGNWQQGRNTMEGYVAETQLYGYEGIETWQTEGNHSMPVTDGAGTACYIPWWASIGIQKTLLWEQYGIPRERNPHWYDYEHSFDSFPWFLEGKGHIAMQFGVLYSTLDRETWGMNHHHRVDFGSVTANQIFCGSLYGNPLTGSTLVLCCACEMPNSTVTVQVTTTSPVTAVDGAGNLTSISPDVNNQIEVNVSYIPTYVRLPAGVTAHVVSVRDWGPNPSPSVSACYLTATLGGVSRPAIATGAFLAEYVDAFSGGVNTSSAGLPDTAEIKFNQTFAVDRVTVFCAPPFQFMCALVDYTIDTWDGSSWTTNTTVAKTVPASFLCGDAAVMGTAVETVWDGGWIEDVTLTGGPVTCRGVRVRATRATLGGAPDALADTVMNGWGASTTSQRITLQRIDVASATAPVAAGSAPSNNTAPFVEGTADLGSQLQCSMNTTIDWAGQPTRFTYQWQKSSDGLSGWVNITGATRSDLHITSDLALKYLRCNVVASNPFGAATAVPSATVAPAAASAVSTGYWGLLMVNNQFMTLPIATELDSTDCSGGDGPIRGFGPGLLDMFGGYYPSGSN